MSIMQTGKTIEYGYVREVALEFEEAVTKIEAALKTEGFGVLIDIQAKIWEISEQPPLLLFPADTWGK